MCLRSVQRSKIFLGSCRTNASGRVKLGCGYSKVLVTPLSQRKLCSWGFSIESSNPFRPYSPDDEFESNDQICWACGTGSGSGIVWSAGRLVREIRNWKSGYSTTCCWTNVAFSESVWVYCCGKLGVTFAIFSSYYPRKQLGHRGTISGISH